MHSRLIPKLMFLLRHKKREAEWREKYAAGDVTIISQNCIGGTIYSDLGIKFSSPTINLLIEGEDFVKLAENPAHYLSIQALPSGYGEGAGRLDCPRIMVGDILVHAVHYGSPEEAASAWNRRRRRFVPEKTYVVGNTWNLGNDPALVKRLNELPFPTIVFSDEAWDEKCVFTLPGDRWNRDGRGIVRPDLTSLTPSGMREFELFFNFVDWLNNAGMRQEASDYLLDTWD